MPNPIFYYILSKLKYSFSRDGKDYRQHRPPRLRTLPMGLRNSEAWPRLHHNRVQYVFKSNSYFASLLVTIGVFPFFYFQCFFKTNASHGQYVPALFLVHSANIYLPFIVAFSPLPSNVINGNRIYMLVCWFVMSFSILPLQAFVLNVIFSYTTLILFLSFFLNYFLVVVLEMTSDILI